MDIADSCINALAIVLHHLHPVLKVSNFLSIRKSHIRLLIWTFPKVRLNSITSIFIIIIQQSVYYIYL